jgi:hypothetical protein
MLDGDMTLLLTTAFALLAVLTWVAAVALVSSDRVRRAAAPHLVGVVSAVTGVATMGSLYLSEVAGYIPCDLCWVQRIAMYPLAVISGVALLRRRTDLWAYAVPLAAIGLATSAWHVVVERVPAAGASCDVTNPCSAIWVERFGFITIPVMAGSGFLFVLVAAWAASRAAAIHPSTGTPSPETHETHEEVAP